MAEDKSPCYHGKKETVRRSGTQRYGAAVASLLAVASHNDHSSSTDVLIDAFPAQ